LIEKIISRILGENLKIPLQIMVLSI
jgi:hypothetical protein